MSQSLPYKDISLNASAELKRNLNTRDDSDVDSVVELRKLRNDFPFSPEKKVNTDNLSAYMLSVMPQAYKPRDKLICDSTDKHKCFMHYRLSKFLVRREINFDKVHSVISFRQKNPGLRRTSPETLKREGIL